MGYRLDGPNAPQAKKDLAALGLDYEKIISGEQTLTSSDIKSLSAKSITRAETSAKKIIKDFDSQPDSVKDVVTEMVFQLGEDGFKKFEKTIAAITAGDYETAADELIDSKVGREQPDRIEDLADKLDEVAEKVAKEVPVIKPIKEVGIEKVIPKPEEVTPENQESWVSALGNSLSDVYNETVEEVSSGYKSATQIAEEATTSMGNAYSDASHIIKGLMSDDEDVQEDAKNYVKNKLVKTGAIEGDNFEYNIDKKAEQAPKEKIEIGKSIEFTKIAEIVSAADGRSYMSFRRQSDNSEGLTYIPVPRKEKWEGFEYDTKLDDMGYKIGYGGRHTTTGVEGIAHFLIDADISGENKEIFKDTQRAINRLKATPDKWIPVYKKGVDGSVNIKYAQGGAEYNALENTGYTDFANLRQLTAADVNWKSMKQPKGFGSAVRNYTTKDGKDTFILFRDPANKSKKGKDAMGQFEGNSVVFLFKDQNGRAIIREFAGSANGIEQEVAEIQSNYGVTPENLTLGFYDAGSYSAKPVSKKGILQSRVYGDFNNQAISGAALAIPTKQRLAQIRKLQQEKKTELDDFNAQTPYSWDLQ
jgi:hypothetical protein